MTTTIFLVRHAAHELGEGILCGRTPGVCLATAGRLQARRLAERLAGEELARVYTSPMDRCRETARLIAARAGIEVAVEPGVNEIDFGRWSGRRFDELEKDPDWRRWNALRDEAETPGGETMRAVQARATAALDRIARDHAGERVAVVSHADVVKAAVMHLLGLSPGACERLDIDLASVTAIAVWEGGGKLLFLNERIGRP